MSDTIQWMGLYPEELKQALSDLGEKPFRAQQVFSWLHKGARFSEMTNLSLALREKLSERYEVVSIDDFMKGSPMETIYEDDVFTISGDLCERVLEILRTGSGIIIDHVITSERIFTQLTEEHKVPATIISRCRKFYFQKIDLNIISDYLANVCECYGKAYDEDALKLIAQASEGCMRDALSILERMF